MVKHRSKNTHKSIVALVIGYGEAHSRVIFFVHGGDTFGFGVVSGNAQCFDGGGFVTDNCASGYRGQVTCWVWVIMVVFGGECIVVEKVRMLNWFWWFLATKN